MSENKDLGQSEPRGVSRRTVTKAMAWSVPVVAVAATAPIAAASPPIIDFSGTAITCKATGAGKGCCGENFYQVALTVKNNGTVTNTVTIAANAATVFMEACQETTTGPVNEIQQSILPGQTAQIIICAGPGNCNPQSSGTVNFTYSYTGSDGGENNLPGLATFAVSPPCGDCS